MSNNDTQVELLREIRDLLTLIAEPQLAARDQARRDQIRKIAGRSAKSMRAVLLMDGSKNQKAISEEVPMDAGQLSALVKALRDAKLLREGGNPNVIIPVSEAVFQEVK